MDSLGASPSTVVWQGNLASIHSESQVHILCCRIRTWFWCIIGISRLLYRLDKVRLTFGRHHHNGKWEARIGRVFGNKYLYLGTYSKNRYLAYRSCKYCVCVLLIINSPFSGYFAFPNTLWSSRTIAQWVGSQSFYCVRGIPTVSRNWISYVESCCKDLP